MAAELGLPRLTVVVVSRCSIHAADASRKVADDIPKIALFSSSATGTRPSMSSNGARLLSFAFSYAISANVSFRACLTSLRESFANSARVPGRMRSCWRLAVRAWLVCPRCHLRHQDRLSWV